MNDIIKLTRGFMAGGVAQKPTQRADEPEKARPQRSPRARLNIIPSPDEMAHLINRALDALSKGIYWDRGSIVNIVL
jgi:hypothetical protein